MARIKFVFVRDGYKERTDGIVIGDHIEEKDGHLLVIDENGKPVYSVLAGKGHFVEVPQEFSGKIEVKQCSSKQPN